MVNVVRDQELELWYVVIYDDQGDVAECYYGPKPRGNQDYAAYESESAAASANPALADHAARKSANKTTAEIDARYPVTWVATAHASKYAEAVLYKSGQITGARYLPHLYLETVRTGNTLAQMADIIFDKHLADAKEEKERVLAKSGGPNDGGDIGTSLLTDVLTDLNIT